MKTQYLACKYNNFIAIRSYFAFIFNLYGADYVKILAIFYLKCCKWSSKLTKNGFVELVEFPKVVIKNFDCATKKF